MRPPLTALTPGSADWWRTYPDVWAAEQAALAAAGASWEHDHRHPPVDGRRTDPRGPDAVSLRRLRVRWPHPAPRTGDPAVLVLHVTFPGAYPWWPPRVHLLEPLPAMRRHRNPINGALCLVADPGDWQPGTTLAGLLRSQLPRVLAASRDDGHDAVPLERGAEPAWARMRLSPGAVLVDSACVPPENVAGGWADVVAIGRWLAPVTALVAVSDASGRPLWSRDFFAERSTEHVPWVRLPAPADRAVEPQELWDQALRRLADLSAVDSDTAEPAMVLVLMSGEGPARQAREDWLLLAVGTPPQGTVEAALEGASSPRSDRPATAAADDLCPGAPDAATKSPAPVRPRSSPPQSRVRVRRGYPIGRTDLTARLPGEGSRLAEASVSVVGVGAIGGPVALELARAGVGHLRLIDPDTHDPATGARQLPTMQAAGSPKAVALALSILDSHPHVQLSAGLRALGSDDGTEMRGLAASTLVIDCTANPAADRYLAAHLALTGTPLLIAAATAGGWGGTITTLPSGGGGCWECLQWHRASRSLPWPPVQPDGELVPAGCADPTFVGGWFDLGQVSLQTVRTALDVLDRRAHRRSARRAFGDVQILRLYRGGRPVQPRWHARRLSRHPSCPLHDGPAAPVGPTVAGSAAGPRMGDR